MRLHNSVRIDGSIFVSRGGRIVTGWFLPHWACVAYCGAAEWLAARKAVWLFIGDAWFPLALVLAAFAVIAGMLAILAVALGS